jgi:hypothetical protein
MRKTAKELLSTGVLDGDEIRAWIYEATTNELEDFLRDASLGEYQIPQEFFEDARAALQLRMARAALKPHWSVVPNFWVTVLAAIAGVAATVICLFEWRQHHLQDEQRVPANHPDKTESSSPASTNSLPYSPPKKQ